jgi:hypothetical protein
MSTTYYPDDPLYEQAKQILAAEPDIGKNRLGARLGIKAPSSRLRIVRYRGETQGHSTHPDYRALREQHHDWSAAKIAQTLGLTIDHVRLHLARWTGAQAYQAGQSASLPVAPPADPESHPRGAELQVSGNDQNQAISYRSSRIKTIEDLLAFSQTDTSVWEVEKHVINKWEVGAKDPASGGILTEPLFQGHVQGRQRQRGGQRVAHRPADAAANSGAAESMVLFVGSQLQPPISPCRTTASFQIDAKHKSA